MLPSSVHTDSWKKKKKKNYFVSYSSLLFLWFCHWSLWEPNGPGVSLQEILLSAWQFQCPQPPDTPPPYSNWPLCTLLVYTDSPAVPSKASRWVLTYTPFLVHSVSWSPVLYISKGIPSRNAPGRPTAKLCSWCPLCKTRINLVKSYPVIRSNLSHYLKGFKFQNFSFSVFS
jgi:hypothetical protein